MKPPPSFPFHLPTLFPHSKTLPHFLQLHALLVKTSPSVCYFNTLIRAYTKTHNLVNAFTLFSDLLRLRFRPDNFTYPFVLKACGSSSRLREGSMVHGLVVKDGFMSDSYVGNTLLHMYASCRDIVCACKVFDEMGKRDVVSWSSMIDGCVLCDHSLEALKVFRQMRAENVEPNSVTLISLLSACTHLTCLNTARSIHSYIILNYIKLDEPLENALIGVYTRCGKLEEGLQIFKSMKEKHLRTWTIMMSGFAHHGHGEEAISLFSQFEERGLEPDSVLFSTILSACSHSGLVKEGLNLYKRMISVYNVNPTMEHYGCMVDLLGRAGLIQAAYEFIKEMPVPPNAVILRSLLGSCRQNGEFPNVECRLTEMLMRQGPEQLGANYVLVANLAALSGKWNSVVELRDSNLLGGMKKVPGFSWVDMGGRREGSGSQKLDTFS